MASIRLPSEGLQTIKVQSDTEKANRYIRILHILPLCRSGANSQTLITQPMIFSEAMVKASAEVEGRVRRGRHPKT